MKKCKKMLLLLNGAYLGLVDYHYNSKDGKFIFFFLSFPLLLLLFNKKK